LGEGEAERVGISWCGSRTGGEAVLEFAGEMEEGGVEGEELFAEVEVCLREGREVVQGLVDGEDEVGGCDDGGEVEAGLGGGHHSVLLLLSRVGWVSLGGE